MRAIALIAMGMLMLATAGCGTLGKLLPGHVDKTTIRSIRIAAQPGANVDSATLIDVAFVYAVDGAGQMPKTSPEWFAQKDAVIAGLGASIDVVTAGVPPGKLLDPLKLPSRHGKAVAVYAYARYVSSNGQARIDLTRYRTPVLWLAVDRITVTQP